MIDIYGVVAYTFESNIEIKTDMKSGEKVFEYIQLPLENYNGKCKEQASLQIQKGEIEFRNVCVRYIENGNLAINNANFKIKGGMKVGIVGRTGAGKSTIV